ncbi:MAG: AAA family ATPase [Firmicutes bacterium]|nr:AAA family ATPase [Bacillota bacterium]
MKKELILGVGLGCMLFSLLRGWDLLPVLLVGILIYVLYEHGGLKVVRRRLIEGSSKTSLTQVTFQQIGGQENAKKELLEALDFIKAGEKIAALGIRPLKGILLTGPPGTGKTLLAKAAANYTEAAFLAVAGSEFIEMYAGIGAQRVRTLFKQARELANKERKHTAIIFIDEIDVLGSKRGQYQGHLEYDQTLNQLLTEMDGIKNSEDTRILIIAATNRPDMLDPALLRPGRFDRVVKVDLPDQEGRLQILKMHTKNKPLDKDVDLIEIAKATFGFSGAHLENLTNEAAILALRENCNAIQQRHLMEAIDKVSLGEKLDRRPQKDQLWRIAIHEVGHAIVSEVIRPGSVATLTIISRGQALGYTRQVPEDDYYLYTETYLKDQLKILLAGLAAEELLLGVGSTGAQGDLDQAIGIAKKMIQAGMSSLGLVSASDLAPVQLQKAISDILTEEKKEVNRILTERQSDVLALSQKLMEKERLDGQELRGTLNTTLSLDSHSTQMLAV